MEGKIPLWLQLVALVVAVAGPGIGVYVAMSNQLAKHDERLIVQDEKIRELRQEIRELGVELRAVNLSLIGWVQRHDQSRQPVGR